MCDVPLLAFKALVIKVHCKALTALKYPNIDVTAMGFPKDWEMEPLWKAYKEKYPQDHRSSKVVLGDYCV